MARQVTPHPHINQIITGDFDVGRGYYSWRPWGTADWLIIYTKGGRGRFDFAGGGEILVEPGDATLLRPRTPHDYGVEPALQRWQTLWAHFHPRPQWLEWLDWPAEAPGLMRIKLRDPNISRKVERGLTEMHRRATGPLRRRETFAMNSLEEVLLWSDLQNPRSEHAPLDPRVRRAMDYLCHNLSEKITLDSTAEAAGLSVSRLAHLFRQQVAATPQQFLEQQRLSRAAQLLQMTSLSIKEVAAEVGFDNPFYFTLRFKRHMGTSPREYRQKGGAETRNQKPE